MKKVTIIIPVYNVAPYLRRCLQSVADQTYPHIECLLIDDCSPDDSVAIAQEFISQYRGSVSFHVLHHRQNQGQGTARNTGLRAATGDYIFFFDGDDAITPDCIATLMALSEQYPDADFVQADTVRGDEQALMPYHFNVEPPAYTDDKTQLEELILARLTMTVWNRLISRPFLLDHQLFFPDGILCEDMYWIYFLAKEVHAAAFTTQGTYYYYRNSNSDANSRSWQNRYRHYEGQMVAVRDFAADMRRGGPAGRYRRQYLAGNLVAVMGNLALLHSLPLWSRYWALVLRTAWSFAAHVTPYRLLLLLAMLPPACFLSHSGGWMWRLKHYIVSKV